MNISMFLKLKKAILDGKVKLPVSYKYSDYMINNGWLEYEVEKYDFSGVPGMFDPVPLLSGYALPTDKGKDVYFSARNHWIKWLLGTFISICLTITTVLVRMILKC